MFVCGTLPPMQKNIFIYIYRIFVTVVVNYQSFFDIFDVSAVMSII